jgi:UDP-N-acetylglucosamine 1-carboxyvinyltransferase
VTGGELRLLHTDQASLTGILDVFEDMGCRCIPGAHSLCIAAGRPIRALRYIKTMPYPGFPTDAQAIVMAALCKANGTSVMEETIFENRYRHVDALVRMGADIRIAGRAAVIRGVRTMHGAQVSATDLRGGAAMLTAALGAEGESVITEISHIDRGYDSPELALRAVGAKIERK